jgi:hypothetical protein
VAAARRGLPAIHEWNGRQLRITGAILAGQLTVSIAAAFTVAQIRDGVTLQAGRHVHGKIVVTL